MTSILKNIQGSVMRYANIISKVLKVEVEIADSNLVRIAGTGIFKNKTNRNMSREGYVYKTALITGKPQIIYNPGKDELCLPCPKRDTCEEKFEMCTPIKLGNESIGVIGLVCIDNEQKNHLMSDFETYMSFLKQISEFISITAYERIEKAREEKLLKSLNLVIDKMDQGIIILNEGNKVTHINEKAIKLLKFVDRSFENIVNIEHTGDSVLGMHEYRLTIGNQNFYFIGNLYPMELNESQFDKIFIFKDPKNLKELVSKYSNVNRKILAEDILGNCDVMNNLKKNIKRIALSNSTVFTNISILRNDNLPTDPRVNFSGYKTETDLGKFYFEEGIEFDNRNQIVNLLELILNYINAEDKITYYIGSNINSGIVPKFNENIIYLNYEGISQNLDFIIFTLINYFGEDIRYGIIYGCSNFIAKELKLNNVTKGVDDEELKQFIDKDCYNNIDLIDLNHPLFINEFSDQETIKYAKMLSLDFTNYLIKKLGKKEFLNKLKTSSDFYTKYYDYMYSYLDSKNIKIGDFQEIFLKFSPYSLRYPTKIEGTNLIYLFEKDFQDEAFKEQCKYAKFKLDYKNIKDAVLNFEKETEQAIQLINPNYDYSKVLYADIKNGKPACYFLNDITVYGFEENVGGITNYNAIFTRTLAAVIHEYTHILEYSINQNRNPNPWLVEGLAEFCNKEFDYYYQQIYLEYYSIVIEGYENYIGMNEIYVERMFIYNRYLKGDESRNFTTWDFDELIKFLNGVETTYLEYGGRTFCNYLIKTYGIEPFLAMYNTQDWDSIYTKNQDELFNEFGQYLSEKFSEYI